MRKRIKSGSGSKSSPSPNLQTVSKVAQVRASEVDAQGSHSSSAAPSAICSNCCLIGQPINQQIGKSTLCMRPVQQLNSKRREEEEEKGYVLHSCAVADFVVGLLNLPQARATPMAM